MVLAWLPALLLLGGRMYIRPETLSLLYLSVFLAILFRWDRFPALTWLLPLVQVAWVNSHGLFILGPVVLVFALADALLRRGALAELVSRSGEGRVPAASIVCESVEVRGRPLVVDHDAPQGRSRPASGARCRQPGGLRGQPIQSRPAGSTGAPGCRPIWRQRSRLARLQTS